MNDVGRRLRDVERQRLRLPPGASALQTFEDGSPLGDTRFLDFGAGIVATLVGDDYVQVRGAGGSRWGTVVVAASDTHDAGKAQADFVCTGTADQTTLDLAIDAAPNGGEIVLLEGNYNISGSWVVDQANIHVRGMGVGTIINSTVSGNAVEVGASSQRFSQMYIKKISGSSTAGLRNPSSTFNDFRADGVVTEGFTWGIRAHGLRWLVRGCRFLNNTTGFQSDITSTTRSAIIGCQFDGGTTGLTVAGLHVVVGYNTLFDQSSSGIISDGTYQTVIGNVVQDGGNNPITLQASDAVCIGNVVRGDGAGAGINGTSSRLVVSGNRVEDVSGDGIYLGDDSVCTGNYVRDASLTGIISDQFARVTVADNYVHLCGRHGIAVLTDSNVTGNTVYACSQTTDATYDGIRVTDAGDRCNIQGNLVRHGGGTNQHKYGINVNHSSCDDNLVTNNSLKNSGRTASLNDSGTGTITAAGNQL